MSQRFGGKFSPHANSEPAATTPPPPVRRRAQAGGRVNFLFILPLFFALRAFWQDTTHMAMGLGVFGLLMLAAWLTREGVLAHEAYAARSIAKRPAIPRKIFGAVLTGAGLGLWTALFGEGMIGAALVAVLGGALHLLAFGPDPMRDKGVEGVDQFQSDRVARAVEEAERHLSDMSALIARLRDRKLEARVSAFQGNVRHLFRTVENDPRRLTAARRYLGVYLLGARDATEKFAQLYGRNRDPEARSAYLALLEDLERNFTARTEALMSDDRQALEIEMSVLRERLQREGLRPE